MIDIQPTMDDSQVMDFVSGGSVVLEGVVSDEFNRQCETLPGGQNRRIRLHTRISGRSTFAPRSRWRRSVAARTKFLHPHNRAPSPL